MPTLRVGIAIFGLSQRFALAPIYSMTMNQLWSPWRNAYVSDQQRAGSGCFLCDASVVVDADQDLGVLHVATHSIVVLNKYPYAGGHVMVTSKRHVGDLLDLEEEEYGCLMTSVRTALKAVRLSYKPHGVNVGMNLGSAAGAGVPDHLHVHIVPRWDGDTNFMPVIGDVKVISSTLDDAWTRIRSALHSSANRAT